MIVADIEHVLHFLLYPSFFMKDFKALLTPEESCYKHITLSEHVVTYLFFPVRPYFQKHVE